MTTLADLIAVLDAAYPPALAESWDSVGLVCGDPAQESTRVMFAVDATEATVGEAIAWGAEALVVHHPLLLRGVDTVAASTPKGALLHQLIRSGCALFTAHTNADCADPGVSDALAARLGLAVTGPLVAKPESVVDNWVIHVPDSHTDAVLAALFAAGAGGAGNYRECALSMSATSQFRPVAAAVPTHGALGELHRVEGDRVEVVAPPSARSSVLAALHAAHPYEDPAYHLTERATLPSSLGIGRIATLRQPESFRAFTDRVARSLPSTVWGVRAAGEADRVVRTVAVCGGSGDSYLDAVTRLGVDVYVTADLRHHPVDEHLRMGGPALIDAAHWATEFPWCAQAEAVVRTALPNVQTTVSALRTDPWTLAAVG
ncbi:Nif3-like dinuclear metal center hexameric protein [Nocardia sp. CNY236]|uniref:Nif3-like dinuclear metal center hexameric protein n=1 Tax=Nocardia sp. CNY236 TaxID=1169152 RepID=UPI0003F5E3B4|nr:Nif3-like dinuclear metal center hexameric protein [Nocardia sp. CNY236]